MIRIIESGLYNPPVFFYELIQFLLFSLVTVLNTVRDNRKTTKTLRTSFKRTQTQAAAHSATSNQVCNQKVGNQPT